MSKAKLTNHFVKNAKCNTDKNKTVFYDTRLSGFMLEVRKTGNKTFYLNYTYNKKRTMQKLGDADIISAEQARRLCIKIKKALASDSLENLFKRNSSAPTLKSFFEKYYLPYVKLHSKSWKHNRSTFTNHILPALGEKNMDEISTPEISLLFMEMINVKNLKAASANKLLTFIKHAYNLALDLKIEGVKENPALRLKPLPENSREIFLNKFQAKQILEAVDESKNLSLKYIVRFLLLTGARRGEVLRAAWRDIDMDKRVWTIPITKNKKIRKIPISDDLLEVIKTIPKTSEWLFPAKRAEGHYTSITAAWSYARKRAGLPNVRIHDLRHTFASTLVNSGRSLYEVQRLLGHSSLKMTQRYAHLNDESLSNAISCAGKLLS